MSGSLTISQLPVTGTIQDGGNLLIETSGVTQRFTASTLKSYLSSGTLTSVTASSATFSGATVTGLLTAGSVATSGDVLIGGNLVVLGTENVTGNVTLANLITQVETAGNVTLSNLIASGNTVLAQSSNGNLLIGPLAAVITTANQPYITTLGSITLANLVATTSVSIQGITTVNSAIVPTSNAAAVNIGSTSSWFNNIYGTAVHALYADLAERYTSDAQYPPGTVVVFGTDTEVTASYKPNDPRVAGVVSTNPAYTMNAGIAGVDVALQGRVPCQVMGVVNRGDMMVTGPIPGVAIANDAPAMGTVIGKALENYNSDTVGIIEVVVGRL